MLHAPGETVMPLHAQRHDRNLLTRSIPSMQHDEIQEKTFDLGGHLGTAPLLLLSHTQSTVLK